MEKQRPVTVKIEDFREKLNDVVGKAQLPPFLIEILLGEYLAGISRVAQNEYAQDRAEWDKACKESEADG